ncbi:XrtY-associated glycosyltransferase XYAG1 [Pedobacter vanadiisoli]|uniref:XrtY-associated glycosyltransferase XYAG1 n=1 Tax=Pedobacter vanadiisoli TaxID=1761975 RepID=A0ABW5MHX8_9SPHI
MKIIHITASYKPAYIYGGPIQSVGKLCEVLVGNKRWALDAQELNLQVLTTTANGRNELDVKTSVPVLVEGVTVTYFKRWSKDHSHFSPGLLWGLRKEILRCAQDDKPSAQGENKIEMSKLQTLNSKLIIHIHAWWNLVSLLSCFIAKWYKIPVVLSPRGMLTSYSLGNRNSFSKRIIHKLMGKQLLKYCHIHATSEQEKTDILKIVEPKSIRVISNLVSLPLDGENYEALETSSMEHRAKGRGRLDDSFKLIFLSRIEEKKGLELLFKALSTIDISWKLTIAGSGERQYVQSLKVLTRELKLSDKIYWIGQVSNEDKYSLMATHDLLVLTSYNENFANVVVESLSVGTPVLISEQVGLSDYVKDRALGWVTAVDTTAIKKNITAAHQDPEKRQNIRNIAPLTIRKDFSDGTLAKEYLEFYKTI